MTKRAEIVSKVFDLLADACYIIKENDRCDECPRKHTCLDATDIGVVGLADLISASAWDEFIEFADHCLPSEDLEELMQDAREYDDYRDKQYEKENF